MRLVRLFFNKRPARRVGGPPALAASDGCGSGIGTGDIDSEAMQNGQIASCPASEMTRHTFIRPPSRLDLGLAPNETSLVLCATAVPDIRGTPVNSFGAP